MTLFRGRGKYRLGWREVVSSAWGEGRASVNNVVERQGVVLAQCWGRRQEPSVEMALTWCRVLKQSLPEAFLHRPLPWKWLPRTEPHSLPTVRGRAQQCFPLPIRALRLYLRSISRCALRKFLPKTHSPCPLPCKVLTLFYLKLVEWLKALLLHWERGKPQTHTAHCDCGPVRSPFLAVVCSPRRAARVK